ncbi:MAG: N-acetylmuramoyl-L-alanine amidase, partial [Ignavibacteriaceae bacterium]
MSKIFLFFIFAAAVNIFAQNSLTVSVENKTYNIPVYERQGMLYFSVKHFAEALSINYYYNSETEKTELKFRDYRLKITAKNPYLVLTQTRNNESEVYQLPTSSYLIKESLFIPLEYSLKALQTASGLAFTFNKPYKLSIKGKLSEIAAETRTAEPSANASFNLTGITIDEKANGTLIRLKSNKRIKTYNSSYKDGRLIITLRDVIADAARLNTENRKGLVKNIQAKNTGNDTEIQFTFNNEYTTFEVIDAPGSNDILITIHNKIFAGNRPNEFKDKWNFDVIVIDAGHGGKDYGAIGVNGTREKDVNLAITLKLGKLIEKNMKGVKVVYTRDNDTFVELYKRGKIANEKGGKLFISIHCNSTPKKPTNATGFEVYLLRPGRTKEAISIAERENSVIQYEENPGRYQQLTDENFILVSMAHSAYMKYSEKFAELLNRQFSNDLNLASRGVKQAGFYVLVGASMPSVLIETGFLSNKKDADYLKSS